MNPSIPSHTPRIRALNYDALRNTLGCQAIEGTAFASLLPFNLVCVADSIFDSIEDVFLKSRTIAYAMGPEDLSFPQEAKFSKPWAAWVASAGVRFGAYASITPPANTLGVPSVLFGAVKPTHLTLGFNEEALTAMAVELAGVITLKVMLNGSDVLEVTWPGVSPQLFSTWLVYSGEEKGGELVCYYLSPVRRNVIYARFESEDFAVEHVIHEDLPVDLDYLVNAYAEGFTGVLLGRGTGGEAVTFTSPEYAPKADDAATLSTVILSGSYALTAVNAELVTEDKATFSARIISGVVREIKVGSTVTEDKATLTATITAGFYE